MAQIQVENRFLSIYVFRKNSVRKIASWRVSLYLMKEANVVLQDNTKISIALPRKGNRSSPKGTYKSLITK